MEVEHVVEIVSDSDMTQLGKHLNQKSYTEYTSNSQIIILLSELQKELRILQKNLDKEWNYIKQSIDFIEECKKELLRK